jgi:hypothetical protein
VLTIQPKVNIACCKIIIILITICIVAIDLAEKVNELIGGAVKSSQMSNLTRLLQTDLNNLTEVCDGFSILIFFVWRRKQFDGEDIPTFKFAPTICPGETLTHHDQRRLKENPISTALFFFFVCFFLFLNFHNYTHSKKGNM